MGPSREELGGEATKPKTQRDGMEVNQDRALTTVAPAGEVIIRTHKTQACPSSTSTVAPKHAAD